MELEETRLYSPEQLSEWEIFGPGVSAEAIRKATRRKVKPLPCTKWPAGSKRGRIMLTKANVEAGLALGLQDGTPETPQRPAGSRRSSGSVTELPQGATRLTAKPQSARRRARAAS